MAYKNIEARREYLNQYQASKIRQWKINLSREYDADIIEFLDTLDNKQGYIKDLIRRDMEKQNG